MANKKYPLEPLVALRSEHAETAKRELGAKIRARESKKEELERARVQTLEHTESVQQLREQERAQLEAGALRAVDLMRQQAWQLHEEQVAENLVYAEKRAATALEEAHTAEQSAQQTAQARMGDLEVVERDRERFVRQVRAAEAAKEEEAAEEAWRPRTR